jgi:GT2 family glycosyltransferase
VTLDDDTSLPDSNSLAKLADTMDRNPDIGMAGGNAVIPDDAIAFVRKAMIQIPRRSWEPVPCITDSDLVQHPCLIMRTDDFKSVGGENELIPRGLDPYLRQEIRKTGKRIVLIPDVNYSHLPPDTLKKLLGQFYRNGTQAAWVNRNYPQWVLETPPSHGNFKIRQPVIVRLFRLPLRTFCALLSGQWIWTACQCAYAAGFAWGITGFDSVRSRRQHQ